MPAHLRQSPLTREWVILAPDRGRRPEEWARASREPTHARPAFKETCPFCPGHPDRTSGETARREGPGWVVRSVPNLYPAVHPGSPPDRQGDLFHHHMPAVGTHEVILESERHDTTLALQPLVEVEAVVEVWRERCRHLRSLPETEHVSLFKNHGPRGGTSLEHPHSQVVSLPVTPWQVRTRMEEAMRFHNDHGACIYCRMLAVERDEAVRLVCEGEHFTAFVPYAAFSPFSLWIFPHRHGCGFTDHREAELPDLARVLRDALARLYHGLGDPDYNVVFRVAGRDYSSVPFFHWYVAIVPRLGHAAGFELGTGMFINPSLPEDDARFLREVEVATPASPPSPP